MVERIGLIPQHAQNDFDNNRNAPTCGQLLFDDAYDLIDGLGSTVDAHVSEKVLDVGILKYARHQGVVLAAQTASGQPLPSQRSWWWRMIGTASRMLSS